MLCPFRPIWQLIEGKEIGPREQWTAVFALADIETGTVLWVYGRHDGRVL